MGLRGGARHSREGQFPFIKQSLVRLNKKLLTAVHDADLEKVLPSTTEEHRSETSNPQSELP